MDFKDETTLSRRTFVKGSLAGLALAGAAGSAALYGCAPAEEKQQSGGDAPVEETDQIVWGQCFVNCGSNCALRYHVRDGKILYLETDNTGDPENTQMRACLRGRSRRRWINSPDRLMHPMKRTGKRGEDKFEQISWDEAIETISSELKRIIDTYGNEAIFIAPGSGVSGSIVQSAHQRLFNMLGGCVTRYGDYSTGCIQGVMPYMFGKKFSPYDNVHASSMTEALNSDLVIMFGNSPAETRMGGGNIVFDYTKVKENGARIIHIDPRMNETCSGTLDEWIPIRTGTDAALVSAIAHELIANDQIDLDFLHTYCVGYDEETMPESAKGQNKSYYDYIMGTGYDMIEKTPEWAAPITQIPADRIRTLASDIAGAKALFVAQGWGPQRHSNGESATRAICMIPLLTGQIGLPGTNTGQREAEVGSIAGSPTIGGIPSGDNPVTVKIPNYEWVEVIDRGEEMTATNAGIRGADKLSTGFKFVWGFAGNSFTNQHGDINHGHDILADESKCEFIVMTETVLTDSAKYADILLPDVMAAEQFTIGTNGYTEWYRGVRVGGPAQEAPGECRKAYDVQADIADKFGIKDQFTEGRSSEDWVEFLYKQTAEKNSDMPSWEEILEQGVWKQEVEPVIGLKDFRDDPVKNALETPSGKIEIYSEELAEIADTWELDEGDVISPIPIFDPGREGYGAVTDEYPLYCSGFHHKARAHSSFGFIDVLKQAARNQMWMNPADAESRGIENGDLCSVKSPRGEIRIEAKVTSRIVPGTVSIPQGAWHDADMYGDRIDHGGCSNTLTMSHPTPLAKATPAHSCIVQVAKA